MHYEKNSTTDAPPIVQMSDLRAQLAECGATIDDNLVIHDPEGNLDGSDRAEAQAMIDDLRRKVTASRKTSRPRGYIEEWNPQAKTIVLLDHVAEVITEYRDFVPLTVRQIYYRLVANHDYPKTTEFYERLCETVAKARRARIVDFNDIRDDGVAVMQDDLYVDADHFLQTMHAAAKSYRRDLMAHQPRAIEVWCEAAGMQPQLARAVSSLGVPVYSSGGFDSLTAKYQTSQRIIKERWRPTLILHLGDCDPSGEAMYQAVKEDVTAFVMADRWSNHANVEFRRVALTAEQVEEYRLPTAPAKAGNHSKSWGSRPTAQLEALAPDVLNDLLLDHVSGAIDLDQLNRDRETEQVERLKLTRLLPAPGGAV